jgi:GNAT superfamily N-acetyltransferase
VSVPASCRYRELRMPGAPLAEVDISLADTADLPAVRELLMEYADGLCFSLAFQGFGEELASLPGAYAPPRGALLVARAGTEAAGCVALRPLDPGICEMKRLFVRPPWRGSGLGARLVEAIVAEGRRLGYDRMRLDTTPEMAAAQSLYARLGFRDIAPYRENPVPGTRFLELTL